MAAWTTGSWDKLEPNLGSEVKVARLTARKAATSGSMTIAVSEHTRKLVTPVSRVAHKLDAAQAHRDFDSCQGILHDGGCRCCRLPSRFDTVVQGISIRPPSQLELRGLLAAKGRHAVLRWLILNLTVVASTASLHNDSGLYTILRTNKGWRDESGADSKTSGMRRPRLGG